jgi:hypothetical protein
VDTTEEARKKLCTYIFDNVKGKINQVRVKFYIKNDQEWLINCYFRWLLRMILAALLNAWYNMAMKDTELVFLKN